MKPISSLLVFIDDTAAGEARVQLACDLAERFDATVIGVGASEPAPPMYDPLGGLGDVLVALREAAEQDIRGAKARFEAVVSARGVRREWREALSLPAAFIAREARSADLVVLGPRSDRVPYRAPDPADVLMAVGRPVLLVPDNYEGSCLDGPALLAWKDTREARRAASAALPLLGEALSVRVLEVAGKDDAGEAAFRTEDVAHYLARHGIKAESQVLIKSTIPTQEVLRNEARKGDVQLIVAGGYGHTRLSEWVFGGVTRALLDRQDVCVLLAR